MEKVGRYRILRRILTGETDAVYLVSESETGRKLVLKMVQLDWFAGAAKIRQLRLDLRRDIENAGRLQHPAIVAPEEVFEQLGVSWIVMNFVPGRDLGLFLGEKQILSKENIRSMLRQVAEALDHAHHAGVTHGRLAPGKIVLQDDGTARVLGFGLTRVSASGCKSNGNLLGSPDYLPPEQLRGDGIYAQSDQYSLAAIAYHLLAGSKPFPGDADEVRQDIVERSAVAPESLNLTLDAEIAAVFDRGLSKSPETRFPTCVAFVDALEKELNAAPNWEVPLPTERARVPLPLPVDDQEQEAGGHSEEPTATAEEPVVAAEKPSVAAEEPVAAAEEPVAVAEERAVVAEEQTIEAEKSAVPTEETAEALVAWSKRWADIRQRWPFVTAGLGVLVVILVAASLYFGWGTPSGPLPPSAMDAGLAILTTELPAGTVGRSYSVVFSAEGGSPPHHWSLAEGSLPPGLSLDASSGEIGGTPEMTGEFPLKATVTAQSEQSATASFRLTIGSDLAIVTPEELPNAVMGREYSLQLATGEVREPAEWSLVRGDLPPGVALAAAEGKLTGSPADAGLFRFTLAVHDASGATAEKTFALRVGSGLTITAASQLPRGAVAKAYSAKLLAEAGKPPLRWSLENGALPPGLSLDPANGTIRGTPGKAGNYRFTARVADASDATASQNFDLGVASNLEITGDPQLPKGVIGNRYSHALSTKGGLAPLLWLLTSGSLPPGLSLDPASGSLDGAPTVAGRFAFDVGIRDAADTTAKRTFSLEIAPPLNSLTVSRPEPGFVGSKYTFALQAKGGIPPYRWLAASGALPPGLALEASRGVIEGVPSAAGAFAIRVRVNDASGGAAETDLTLEIIPSLAISTSSPLPEADLAAAYSVPLQVSGGQPPYAWAIVEGSLPPGLSLDEGGRISGRPAGEGVFSFSAGVTDRSGAKVQRAFRMRARSSLRIAVADVLPAGREGEPYSYTLTASGGQEPYRWRRAGGELPPGMELAPSGTIRGTPTEAGRFVFEVGLRGASPGGVTQSMELSVQPPNSGQIVWRGLLESNRVLTIQDGRYPSTGTLTGELPGVPVEVQVQTPGVSIVSAPAAENDWKLLVIHSGEEPRSELIINWKNTTAASPP